jgi:tol-pal system protein YbgF
MKRLAVLALFAAIGCGSGQTDDGPLPVVVPSPTPMTDPRVSELQVMVSELLDRIEVLNARIQKLESGAPNVPASPVRSSSPAARPTPAPSAVAAARPAATPSTPPVQRRPAGAPLTTAQIGDRYKDGLVLFGKGQIDNARRAFEEVFAADQAGELADNAVYWIGETYFVTGKYNEAMAQYRKIAADYADQNKAPDALLKMGMVQAKLGDLVLARQTFDQVIQTYPYSTAAASAKAELKRIQY